MNDQEAATNPAFTETMNITFISWAEMEEALSRPTMHLCGFAMWATWVENGKVCRRKVL